MTTSYITASPETSPRSAQNNALGRRGRVKTISPPHPRRPPERKTCEICKADGSGKKFEFRGQHELDRHNNKQHAKDKKRWICLDPTPDKRHSWCKNCREGKEYAVNYNAAQHIRRQHVYPDGSEKLTKKARGSHKNSRRSSSPGHDQQKLPTIQELLRTGWVKVRIVSDETEVGSDAASNVYTSHDEDVDDETMEDNSQSNDKLDDDSFQQSTSTSGASTVRPSTAESVSAGFLDASQHWQFNDMRTYPDLMDTRYTEDNAQYNVGNFTSYPMPEFDYRQNYEDAGDYGLGVGSLPQSRHSQHPQYHFENLQMDHA